MRTCKTDRWENLELTLIPQNNAAAAALVLTTSAIKNSKDLSEWKDVIKVLKQRYAVRTHSVTYLIPRTELWLCTVSWLPKRCSPSCCWNH